MKNAFSLVLVAFALLSSGCASSNHRPDKICVDGPCENGSRVFSDGSRYFCKPDKTTQPGILCCSLIFCKSDCLCCS